MAEKIARWQAAEIIGISDGTCDAGRSARMSGFRGCLTGGAAGLPESPNIFICYGLEVFV
jgi:hypothetical protein